MTANVSTQRQVFVAYSYKAYPKADYRKIFSELESAYAVRFIFADEKITNMHIMQKIVSYIRSSDFSLFDISGWNPNVTLELGFAMATNDQWYIALNPSKTEVAEVPSDLRGLDRIQYDSFDDFSKKLSALLEQKYPKRQAGSLDDYLSDQRTQLLEQLKKQDGFNIADIAQLLGVEVRVAQLIVQPLVGSKLRTTGNRKGTRYFLV